MPSNFRRRNVIAIRQALDLHNTGCAIPARAILLNPVDHGLMLFDELWGVPVLPDERVRVKFFRIECADWAHGIEREIEAVGDENPVSLRREHEDVPDPGQVKAGPL